MEILRLSGYSEEEKMQIARRYLIPRQLKQTGLTDEQCRITEDGLKKLITGYTREAGCGAWSSPSAASPARSR